MRRGRDPLCLPDVGPVVPCTNCGTLIHEGVSNALYSKYTTAEWDLGPWCNVECYLSFVKPRQPPLVFTRMRTDISTMLGRTLKERQPRSSLQSYGGPLTLQAYHSSKVLEWYNPSDKRQVE